VIHRKARADLGVQSQPMTKAEIVTAIIAIYGAAVSTFAVVKQFAADRVRVKIMVNWDMVTQNDPQFEGVTVIFFKVVNLRQRPVTITHTGARSLYPTDSFMFKENRPALPREIKEGEYIESIVTQDDTDRATIDYWQAMDSTGRVYKLREASWIKHWKSVLYRNLTS
jgi:hypothetical protein